MISLVIPTKDRREVLLDTLRVVSQQALPAGGAEVVVVDNGSSDGSLAAVEELAATFPIPLRTASQPRPGPASARHTGVAESRGEVILFLGDDTAPAAPDVLARHAELHRRSGAERAVLGRVAWSPSQEVTPFMRWLESGGIQFDYERLDAGPVPVARSFWTAHVSLKREALDAAGGFDERFPDAAMEDVELRCRLNERGIEFRFVPDAGVCHPWRTRKCWRELVQQRDSTRLYLKLHPDERRSLGPRHFVHAALYGLVRFTLPDIARGRGRGLHLALLEHLSSLDTALRIFCDGLISSSHRTSAPARD